MLLGFTVNSMGYGPALAAKLGTGFASDVFAVRDEGGASSPSAPSTGPR